MSDWLVALQEKLAGYPAWLVIGGAVIVLAGIFMLLGRILKILGVLMFVGLAAAGAWYFWQRMSDEPPSDAPPATRLQKESQPTGP